MNSAGTIGVRVTHVMPCRLASVAMCSRSAALTKLPASTIAISVVMSSDLSIVSKNGTVNLFYLCLSINNGIVKFYSSKGRLSASFTN